MANKIDPIVLAMIVCDHVHIDQSSGKYTLVGTFNQIATTEFPSARPVGVYVAMTGLRGKVKIVIQIIDVNETRDPINIVELEAEAPSPNTVPEMGGNSRIVFPEPGDYRLQLMANGSLVMERRMMVRQYIIGDQSDAD